MRIKSPSFAPFVLKSLFILHCILVGLGSTTIGVAQSVVGKWNQVSSKQFLTAQSTKSHGKSVLEAQTSTIGSLVIEFKSNHTYVMKSTSNYNIKVPSNNGSKGHTLSGSTGNKTFRGTWTLSGNKLEMPLDAHQEDPKNNPLKDTAAILNTSISIIGTTMVMSTDYPNSKITSKTENTFTKL